MLITQIQLPAMSRVHMPESQRRDFFLYVDEFQNFATESFVKILSEARKYRLNLTLANQYVARIPERTRAAVLGNCGSLISFLLGARDASLFRQEFNQQYSMEDLVGLGRYQSINRLAIDNVSCAPFPATTVESLPDRSGNRAKVLRVSRERYAARNR